MILLPAIDLMGGQVVRLRQGKAAEKTVYSKGATSFPSSISTRPSLALHRISTPSAPSLPQ